MTELAGLHHLNLTVTDIRASLGWYQDLLSLEKSFERTDARQGWSKAGLYDSGSGLRLNFTEHHAASRDAFDERTTGLDHVAFLVKGGLAGLERWIARLDERGIAHSEIKRGDVGDLITFRDPDNIQLELYATADS
jgi:glyoxylase I family protein